VLIGAEGVCILADSFVCSGGDSPSHRPKAKPPLAAIIAKISEGVACELRESGGVLMLRPRGLDLSEKIINVQARVSQEKAAIF
jgi:hypothetical protein